MILKILASHNDIQSASNQENSFCPQLKPHNLIHFDLILIYLWGDIGQQQDMNKPSWHLL